MSDVIKKQLKVVGNANLAKIAKDIETTMKSKCGSKRIRSAIKTENRGDKYVIGIDQDQVARENDKHDFSKAYVFGAKSHIISAKKKKSLYFYWDKVGQYVSPYSVNHPGSPEHPFIDETVSEIKSRYPNIKEK